MHSDPIIPYRSLAFNTSDGSSYYYDGNKWVKLEGNTLKKKMEEDTISRCAAMDAFYHIKCNLQMMDDTQTADKMMHGLRLAENAINKLPSVQEIIRCRRCKWWSGEIYRECTSPNWDTGTSDYFICPPGFFCGWAEGKDE